MDNVVMLKKVSVVAAVMCLPLWWLAYAMAWGGWAEMSGDFGWLSVGGVPLALALLIAGYALKRRKVAALLCAAGLALFAVTAVWAITGVVTLNG